MTQTKMSVIFRMMKENVKNEKKTHQASTITFSLCKIEGVKVFFSFTEETEKNRCYTTISYLDYLFEYFFSFFLLLFIFFLLLFLCFFFFEFSSSLIIIMIFYLDPMPVYIFLLKWARKIMVNLNMLSVWFASRMKEEKSIFLRKFFFVGSCNEIYTFVYT